MRNFLTQLQSPYLFRQMFNNNANARAFVDLHPAQVHKTETTSQRLEHQTRRNARAFVDLRTTQVHKHETTRAQMCTYTQPKYTKPRKYARKWSVKRGLTLQTREKSPANVPQNGQRSHYKCSLTKLALEVHWTSNLSEFPLRVTFARHNLSAKAGRRASNSYITQPHKKPDSQTPARNSRHNLSTQAHRCANAGKYCVRIWCDILKA